MAPVCSTNALPDPTPNERWTGPNTIQPQSWDEAADYTEVFYEDQWAELTDAEKSALNFYKSGRYRELNDALRFPEARQLDSELMQIESDLDSALTKLTAPDDLVTMRFVDADAFGNLMGAELDEDVFWLEDPRNFIGTVFRDDAYTSTSLASDFDWASQESVRMFIRIPRGYEAGPNDIGLMDRSVRTAGTTEAEIMLKRGTRFRLVDVEAHEEQAAWVVDSMTLEVIP